MSLETKGTIKWDPDVKPSEPQYVMQAKSLGISEGGSGNLEQMIDELTERIRREVSQEFGIPRCDVQLVKYTMTLTFDVSAPVNRTLEEFVEVPEKTKDLEKKIRSYAERTGQDPLVVLEELKKEAGIKQQTVLDKAADMVNSGALDGEGYTVTATGPGGKAPVKKKGKGAVE